MRRAVGLALLLSACGRFGFDGEAAPDGVVTADSAVDAEPDAHLSMHFDPLSNSCTDAASGPFLEVGAIASAPTGGGYGVWVDHGFILMSDELGGLHSLTFDGATFTQVGDVQDLGWVESTWTDGVHLYVSAPGTGLSVVDLDASTGALALAAKRGAPLEQARHGWVSDGTIYVPAGGDGMFAVTYDGTNLATKGAATPTQNWGQGAYAMGSRVLFADGDAFRVVDFDGAAFTDAIMPITTHPGTTRIWNGGDYFYLAAGDGVTAFTLAGAQVQEIARFVTNAPARDVWSDGQHIFVAAQEDGFYALAFDGANFSEVAHVPTTTEALGIVGDGTYIYANAGAAGLRAYRGFACASW